QQPIRSFQFVGCGEQDLPVFRLSRQTWFQRQQNVPRDARVSELQDLDGSGQAQCVVVKRPLRQLLKSRVGQGPSFQTQLGAAFQQEAVGGQDVPDRRMHSKLQRQFAQLFPFSFLDQQVGLQHPRLR